MRTLLRAEALVGQQLLLDPGAAQVAQMRATGVPRRTFQATRQRILRRGWVEPRLVPDPTALGLPYVTVALAQPYVEAVPKVVEAWRRLPGVVDLWSSGETVLGVRFWPRSASDPAHELPHVDGSHCRSVYQVEVDLRQRGLPIFFDFEGVWSRTAGVARDRAYPRALPRSRGDGEPGDGVVARQRARLVAEVMEGGPGPRGAMSAGSFLERAHYERRLRRCLAQGWVERRGLLEPASVHDSVETFADRMAFVAATLTEGHTPEELLGALLSEARLAPFLFVSDGSRLLFGVLAADRAASYEPEGRPRTTAFEVLKARTTGIVTVREPLRSLGHVVDYRFDRVVDALPESGGPPAAAGEAAAARVATPRWG